MSLQSEIIQKFQLNPTHAQHCERCFDETSSLNFWIWDPLEAPEEPYLEADAPTKNHAYLLLTPTSRQRRESLEINCKQVKEHTFAALDGCLITDGSRCDGLLLEGKQQASLVVWIELKMTVKQRILNLKG